MGLGKKKRSWGEKTVPTVKIGEAANKKGRKGGV